jgi:hypothetical protein
MTTVANKANDTETPNFDLLILPLSGWALTTDKRPSD